MPRNRNKRELKSRGTKKMNPLLGEMRMLEGMEHPPQIDGYQIVTTKRLRFTATAATNVIQITFQNLLDTMLVATTAVAGFDLFDLVRIKSVEVWGIAALGTPSSLRVSFNTATGDQILHSDTSLGFKPAFIRAKPDSKSLASFFQLSGAGNAFALSVPAGAVVDVTLQFKTTSTAPTAAQNALVGAVTGEFYFRGLDGLASAGTNFPPPTGVSVI